MLPQSFGNLSSLVSLHLHNCPHLMELPSTIGNLRKLTSLTIIRCPLISEIPQGASNLTNLVDLQICYCEAMSTLPEHIGSLQKLVTFQLHHNKELSVLPSSISQLRNLISFELGDCNIIDGGLPDEYSTLLSLQKIFLQYNPFSRLPERFHLLPKLQSLELHHCKNLCEIPHLPPTLRVLDIGDCPPSLRELPCLFSLKELRDLVLCNCTGLRDLVGLECLCHLSKLNITGCRRLESLPSGLASLTSLKSLYLAGNGSLSQLRDNEPWIQKLISLELISVEGNEVHPNCWRSEEENANDWCMEVVVPGGGIAYKAVIAVQPSHIDFLQVTRRNTINQPAEDQVSQLQSRELCTINIDGGLPNHYSSLSFLRKTFPGDKSISVSEGAVKLINEVENETEETLREFSARRQAKDTGDKVQAAVQPNFFQPHRNTIEPAAEEPGSLELREWSNNDGGLPNDYSSLSTLQKISLADKSISRLPRNFHLLTNLQSLALNHCNNLFEISSLPLTLMDLDMGDCVRLQGIPCLSSLKELRDLVLCNCTALVELLGLQCLHHLSKLNITGCTSLLSLPSGLENLTSLKSLYLAGSGVSLLQDHQPWIQKLVSLEFISLYRNEVPDCLLSSKVQIQGVIAKQYANECCMEVALPEGYIACKAVLCCFVSHDQGWSIYPRNHGRYQNSHTSMHAEIVESGADSTKFTQLLSVNRHADRRNQLHMSIFRAPHPFVASLRCNDTIRVIAKSRFPGWAITVSEGAVKLISGENEIEETLQELSRQT